LGDPDDGRSVGRRNLSGTGKPRGLREISGRTSGGDQANRLTEAAPVGVPAARRCRGGRHLVYAGRKPGPAPWGLPPSGPASAPLGGRAWPRALPRQREGGLPGEGSRNPRGVKLRKNGEGQKDPRGRGLPAGIPEAQPAAPGLMGGWVATKRPQPRRAAGRVAPGNPRGTAPPSAGEGRGSPLPPRGEEGGRRPKGPAGPQAVESPGLRDALIPKGPPLSPPPTGGGFRFVPQGLCTGPVRRRAHSRRAPGKGTPPHGRWGGVGAWGSPVQGEVRMVPYHPTATKRPFP
jgi:hypothetical protein